MRDHTFLMILLSGLAFRLALIAIPGFEFDMTAWFAWALRLNQTGFGGFYSDEVWTHYTPGYLYVLRVLGAFGEYLGFSQNAYYYILKIPGILSDIILGIIIYRITVKCYPKQAAQIASAAVLLNPAFIFNSAIWGQIDGLLGIFMLVSIIALSKKALVLSSMCFAIALLIKPQAISIAPVFVIYLLQNLNIKNFLFLFLPASLAMISLTMPFFPQNPLLGLSNLVFSMSNDYAMTSVFAYNFWGIFGFWIPDTENFMGITYQNWGFSLYIIFWVTILALSRKKPLSVFALATLAVLSFYFLPTRVHDRYLLPALLFLVITAVQYRSKYLFVFFIPLSILHLANLYFVYIYYNYFYSGIETHIYWPSIYSMLAQNGRLLSATSTLLFIAISAIIMKNAYPQNHIKKP